MKARMKLKSASLTVEVTTPPRRTRNRYETRKLAANQGYEVLDRSTGKAVYLSCVRAICDEHRKYLEAKHRAGGG